MLESAGTQKQGWVMQVNVVCMVYEWKCMGKQKPERMKSFVFISINLEGYKW